VAEAAETAADPAAMARAEMAVVATQVAEAAIGPAVEIAAVAMQVVDPAADPAAVAAAETAEALALLEGMAASVGIGGEVDRRVARL